MVEKNKKIIKTFLWGVSMIFAILLVVHMKSIEKDNHNTNSSSVEQENGIIYDGSGNNPYIKGVQ